MDYSWLADLNKVASNAKLFSVAIVGAKSLAMTFILMRIIGNFLQTAEGETPKIGGIMNIIGFGLLIVSSDWIVNAIESMFAGVDIGLTVVGPKQGDALKTYLAKIEEGVAQKDVWDRISFYIELLPLYITTGLMTFAQEILKILDMAVVSMYLVQRVFLIQLFKVIFPFAVAFSTLSADGEKLKRWINIYIGLFFLGIAYAAIIKFSDILFKFIQTKIGLNITQIAYDTPLTSIFAYTVGALLISFMVKLSLFSLVTREVRNFFN